MRSFKDLAVRGTAAILLIACATAAGVASRTTAFAAPHKHAATNSISADHRFDVLSEVLKEIHTEYVDKPNEAKMVEGAINGMLAALDPHSSYMNPQQFREMQEQLTGDFGGLGIEIDNDNGAVKIVSTLADTPASRGGLTAGDVVTGIDGKTTAGIPLEQIAVIMRGPIGSVIALTIRRPGTDGTFDVKLKRDVVHVSSVEAHAEDDIAYLKVSSFMERTQDEFDHAIDKMKREIGPRLKGFVLDLRNDPGGLVDQAEVVSGDFLEHGDIVVSKGRDGKVLERSRAAPGEKGDGKPLIVLINGGSASAAEIVAGALQDNKRALVIGTQSFGKGTVQSIIPLEHNKGAIRLTTARYFTPSGRSIQARGITPDIVVEEEVPDALKRVRSDDEPQSEAALPNHLKNSEDKAEENPKRSLAYVPDDPKKDTQLQYALRLMREGHALSPHVEEAKQVNP